MGKQRRRRYRQPRAHDSVATIRLNHTRWSQVRDLRLCQQRGVQRRDTAGLRHSPQASRPTTLNDHHALSRLTKLMFAHDTQASSSFLASALRIEVDECATPSASGEASPARRRRCAGPEKKFLVLFIGMGGFFLARRNGLKSWGMWPAQWFGAGCPKNVTEICTHGGRHAGGFTHLPFAHV